MQAMEIVQRNERGRQGKQKALMLKEIREEEKRRKIYDTSEQLEMDPEIAAANIQVVRTPTFTLATKYWTSFVCVLIPSQDMETHRLMIIHSSLYIVSHGQIFPPS